ncbi:MAG: NYN domain-containing protein [bacterium]|nr:NYN domain-containing protein [bacterium]
MCAHRVVVFIDYQNVYHLARSAFGHEGSPDRNVGHVYPLKVGEMLCDLGRSSLPDRELGGVRVYRGLPDARSGADLVRFTSRQIAGWQRSAGIVVKTRPLAYHQSTAGGRTVWRAQEKGVDVMLAVDVVDMARTDAYDTAVVFSADTDLLPALEAAVEIGKRIETATWRGHGDNRGPMRIKQRNLWNHYLDYACFEQVRDDTDYLAGP